MHLRQFGADNFGLHQIVESAWFFKDMPFIIVRYYVVLYTWSAFPQRNKFVVITIWHRAMLGAFVTSKI